MYILVWHHTARRIFFFSDLKKTFKRRGMWGSRSTPRASPVLLPVLAVQLSHLLSPSRSDSCDCCLLAAVLRCFCCAALLCFAALRFVELSGNFGCVVRTCVTSPCCPFRPGLLSSVPPVSSCGVDWSWSHVCMRCTHVAALRCSRTVTLLNYIYFTLDIPLLLIRLFLFALIIFLCTTTLFVI